MTDFKFQDKGFNEEQRQREMLALQQQQHGQQLAAQQQQNPFEVAMQRYGQNNLPDSPINYGGSMAEFLLSDNEVPEIMRNNFWWVFHKDNVLTFLDTKRKKSKLLNFDISRIDVVNTLPYYDYDFDLEMKFGILRNVLETKLDRAMGTSRHDQKNERTILQSQFIEQRNIQEMGQGMVKEGFFKRLLGRR